MIVVGGFKVIALRKDIHLCVDTSEIQGINVKTSRSCAWKSCPRSLNVTQE